MAQRLAAANLIDTIFRFGLSYRFAIAGVKLIHIATNCKTAKPRNVAIRHPTGDGRPMGIARMAPYPQHAAITIVEMISGIVYSPFAISHVPLL
jgi:hypothetical protein